MTIAANRPLKGARSRAFLNRALGWWLRELRGFRDDLRRFAAAHSKRSVTIEAGERYWMLRQGSRPIGQIDTKLGDTAQSLRLTLPVGRRRPIIVEIPPERALAKTIVLPAGAKGQLDRIIGFEIARHFPFPAERVYYQHRSVGKVEGGSGAVTVEIVAVPREVVDGICLALSDAGVRPTAIAVAADAEAKPLFLPLAQQAELESIDREIAVLKPRAEVTLRAGEAERRIGERSAAILALSAGRPPLVAALAALSRDLPDGAWLLSLSIAGREVVLDGLAPSAATVALALEKTHDLSSTVFRSPITRETSGLEHFQLGATLSEVKP
jgi:hypothetical protein